MAKMVCNIALIFGPMIGARGNTLIIFHIKINVNANEYASLVTLTKFATLYKAWYLFDDPMGRCNILLKLSIALLFMMPTTIIKPIITLSTHVLGERTHLNHPTVTYV